MNTSTLYAFFVLFDKTTGAIASYGDHNTEEPIADLPEELDVVYFVERVAVNVTTQSINTETLELVNVAISEPEFIPTATWENIKEFRNKFADTPVTTEKGLLDVDSNSMETLQMAEDHFTFLPTVENGKLAWKMADNTIVYLTHPELIAMNAEAKDLRAKQVAIMFYRAEVLRAMDPAPLLEYVASYQNWIEP